MPHCCSCCLCPLLRCCPCCPPAAPLAMPLLPCYLLSRYCPAVNVTFAAVAAALHPCCPCPVVAAAPTAAPAAPAAAAPAAVAAAAAALCICCCWCGAAPHHCYVYHFTHEQTQQLSIEHRRRTFSSQTDKRAATNDSAAAAATSWHRRPLADFIGSSNSYIIVSHHLQLLPSMLLLLSVPFPSLLINQCSFRHRSQ